MEALGSAVGRPAGRIDAVQEITFYFLDDQLFSVTVVYDARFVEGLTNMDIIDAVSAVYGPATLTAAASRGPAGPVPGAIDGSTALARWQSADHEFTLMREVYPATFRLVGVSRRLEAVARAAETEATRLDRLEAPRREAERAAAEAEPGKQPRTRGARRTRANFAREELIWPSIAGKAMSGRRVSTR